MNRILFEPAEAASRNIVLAACDRRAIHIRNVLHASVGDRIRVGVVGGLCGTAAITSMTGGAIAMEAVFDTPSAAPWFDLLIAMPRPKVMRRMWAPLASLGVRDIIVVGASKVERFYFDTHVLDEDFIAPLLREGMEQSGTTYTPRVRVFRRFRPLVEDVISAEYADSPKIVAHPYSEQAALPRFQTEPKPGSPLPMLAIGPEGGWTDFELGLLGKAGFAAVSLGRRPLRTDIATYALLGAMADS
ncbi:MAG: RsmE family RNA methyltransferase [Kiritimatiellae bacterium]|nr:RsmE family RNA methyltransferase [Kiritimatiellia bacterium]